MNLLNKTMVVCRQEGCMEELKAMSYEKFLKHAEQCQQVEIMCPLNCYADSKIHTYDEGMHHYLEECP